MASTAGITIRHALGRQRAWLIVCYGLFTLAVLHTPPLSVGGEAKTDRTKPSSHEAEPRVRLKLALDKTKGMQVVLLTVTNAGTHPVVIDRELVFGFDVGIVDERGSVLDFARDASIGNWTLEKWKQRITTLSPGHSLTRRIDLVAGVKNFSFMVSPPPTGLTVLGQQEEILQKVAPQKLWKRSRGPIYLSVQCRVWVAKHYVGRYTGLRKEAEELTEFDGFRAIHLITGKQYDIEEYNRLYEEDERTVREDEEREGEREMSQSPHSY